MWQTRNHLIACQSHLPNNDFTTTIEIGTLSGIYQSKASIGYNHTSTITCTITRIYTLLVTEQLYELVQKICKFCKINLNFSILHIYFYKTSLICVFYAFIQQNILYFTIFLLFLSPFTLLSSLEILSHTTQATINDQSTVIKHSHYRPCTIISH